MKIWRIYLIDFTVIKPERFNRGYLGEKSLNVPNFAIIDTESFFLLIIIFSD